MPLITGRPRKSESELQMAGTFRKDRHANRLTAATVSEIPPAPKDFDAEHAEYWTETCELLRLNGILTKTDPHSIREYTVLSILQKQMFAVIKSEGVILRVDNGRGETVKSNPAVEAYTKLSGLRMSLMDRFGFSPKARQGLKTEQVAPEKSEFEKLFDMAGAAFVPPGKRKNAEA